MDTIQTSLLASSDIILERPEQWDDWISNVENRAGDYDLSEYISLTGQDTPEEPVAPRLEEWTQLTETPESTGISTRSTPALSEPLNTSMISIKFTILQQRQRIAEQFSNRKIKLTEYIRKTNTLDTNQLLRDKNARTLNQMIQVIKHRFAPEDGMRMQLLTDQLQQLRKGPSAKSPIKWAEQWIPLEVKLRRANHPELNQLPVHFVGSLHLKDNAQFNSLYSRIKSTTPADMRATLEELVQDYVDIQRIRNSNTCSGRSTFASFMDEHTPPSSSYSPTTLSYSQQPSVSSQKPPKPSQSRQGPKGCGNITGNYSHGCQTLGECNVINPKKRPHNRSPQWIEMFNSYLAFCRTDKAKGLLRALNNRWKDEERSGIEATTWNTH